MSLIVLVIYDDLETGFKASEVLNRTLLQIGAHVDVNVDFWRSSLFLDSEFLQQAANQEADIIVISTRGQSSVPESVREWFRGWLDQRGGKPRALAVLIDDTAKETMCVPEMLDKLIAEAEFAGVDVFLNTTQEVAEWKAAIEDIHRRVDTKTQLLDEVLHQAKRHCQRDSGMNE